jgi:hypothetical protein
MPTRLQLSTARRRALTAQSEALRARLVSSTQGVVSSLRLGQLGVSAWRSVRRHPALLVGVAVALMVAGPQRALRLASLGLGAWSTVKRVGSLLGLLAAMGRRR